MYTQSATLAEHPILDRQGKPQITRRALVLVDASGRVLTRQPFNPWSGCSRLLARRRIAQDAQRLGVAVA